MTIVVVILDRVLCNYSNIFSLEWIEKDEWGTNCRFCYLNHIDSIWKMSDLFFMNRITFWTHLKKTKYDDEKFKWAYKCARIDLPQSLIKRTIASPLPLSLTLFLPRLQIKPHKSIIIEVIYLYIYYWFSSHFFCFYTAHAGTRDRLVIAFTHNSQE